MRARRSILLKRIRQLLKMNELDYSPDILGLMRARALTDKAFSELDRLFHSSSVAPVNINGPADAQKIAIMLALLDGETSCLLVPLS